MSKQMVLFGIGIVLAATSLGASIVHNVEVEKDLKLRALRIENAKMSYERFDYCITEWNAHVKNKIPDRLVSNFRRAAFRAMRTGTCRDFNKLAKSMNKIAEWQRSQV